MTLEGKQAPAVELETADGTVNLPSGEPTVLYFYPKDDTPGCTTEAIEFTEALPQFEALGVAIIGVSPDTLKKHERFAAKHSLGIALASDADQSVAEAFGVWVEKSMYGRTYMGIDRSTFLIGADGTVLQEWRGVRVKGHVEAVLDAARLRITAN
ncbi:peroxiredoxin [Rhizobiaceae bacterium]|nr:peroxiredoxin [Rhizobiaceae bacterium]